MDFRHFSTLGVLALLLFFIVSHYYGPVYEINEPAKIGNLSFKVAEYKTTTWIVQKSIVVKESPSGPYVTEGGYETIESNPGYKFALIHLEIVNTGQDRLHMMGLERKELKADDGTVYGPGITSKKLHDSTPDEISRYYFPSFISIQTLLPGQKHDGWIIFEIPEYTNSLEFRWFEETFDEEPSIVIKLEK